MRRSPLAPELHVFVCANRRAAGDPLGPGCGEHGDAVYDAMKREVARRGAYRATWVTRTHCLGLCPKHGCGVALSRRDAGERLYLDVVPEDVATLLAPPT